MSDICIFRRIEKKYLLTPTQYNALRRRIDGYLEPDEYGRSTVMSLYLDTPDHRLIRSSIEAVDYKEKLRLRSYGTPRPDSRVFLELKKKFDGVVYKRRVSLTLRQADAYIRSGIKPFDSQVFRELDYAMRFYGNPSPAALISYERLAYVVPSERALRITFDSDARYRVADLRLTAGSAGKRLLPEGTVILEIKTDGGMPLWLSRALDECGIRPGSFSKYGAAYRDLCRNETRQERVMEDIRYA